MDQSPLQKYLERQKNQQADAASQSRNESIERAADLKPKFGLNSAYFMWVFEAGSARAKQEFKNWQERRKNARKFEPKSPSPNADLRGGMRGSSAGAQGTTFQTGGATTSGTTSATTAGMTGAQVNSAGELPPQFVPVGYPGFEVGDGTGEDIKRPLTWAHAEFGARLLATIVDWILIYMIIRTIPKFISLPFFSSEDVYSTAQNGLGGTFGPSYGQNFGQSFTQSIFWNVLPTSFFLTWTIVAIPYYGFFYSQRGASPGKLAFGLQVIDARSGNFLTAWIAIFRETIGKTFSFSLFMLGYLMAAFRSDRRAFHDLLFETVVVRIPPQR